MKNGPAPSPIYVGAPTPLARADLDRLAEGNRMSAAQAGTVKRLRESHHMIARLAALGLRPKVIAERVGMSRERVGHLCAAPAMVELIALYRAKVDEKFEESVDAFFEISAQNMLAAQRHIADRFAELDDEGELMPVREALAVAADSADRVGYGKRSTNVNINVDFAAQLEKARSRSAKVITHSPVQASPQPKSPSLPSPSADAPAPLLRRRA